MAAKHLLHMTLSSQGYVNFTLTHEGDFDQCGTWPGGHEGPGPNGELLPECFLIDWLSELGADMLDGEWPTDPHFPLPVKWEGSGECPNLVYDPPPLITDAEADKLIAALADADLYGQLVAPELDDE